MHVCSQCGLIAVANLKKSQFWCTACKNTTGIVQVGAGWLWSAGPAGCAPCWAPAPRPAPRRLVSAAQLLAAAQPCPPLPRHASPDHLWPRPTPPPPHLTTHPPTPMPPAQVFMPYAAKLLFQELMAMCIGAGLDRGQQDDGRLEAWAAAGCGTAAGRAASAARACADTTRALLPPHLRSAAHGCGLTRRRRLSGHLDLV